MKEKLKKYINAESIIYLITLILLIIFFPLVTIWALNTIFNAGIAYSIYTWAATTWLTGIVLAKAR